MKIGIVANKNYSEKITPFFCKFLDWLQMNDVDFCVESEFADIAGYPYGKSLLDMLKMIDLLIVLGGDGTILRAARLMRNKQIPMLGIRFGRLGFLAELSGETYEKKLKNILSGDYKIDKRMVLESHINTYDETLFGLNDAVFFRAHSFKLITMDVHVDNEYMNTFQGDGLIIATPTGSTAYSLSSGGPIVTPGINAFIINPICPHMLSNRPTVVSGDSEIRITFKELTEGCMISIDGQQDIPIKEDTIITIKRAPYDVQLVRSTNSDFFSVVRNKLKWTQ
ncbi:MAG: NAD(+)/NADH kinase [Candidatus Marinimicrobia bacterium]|nr:NAD(+)/NADH kinase [Candidatus Neomarinimicrobiota bacterium]